MEKMLDERKERLINTPKVSVIVPVYNAEKYLRDCVDSIVNQTLRDIEVILVDDGSTDESLSILREYERKDHRISVIPMLHVNAGAARNCGLSLAKGEYISFLDADDFFEVNMLEEAYFEAKKQLAEIVVFRSDAFDGNTDTFISRDFTIREKNLPKKKIFAGVDIEQDFFSTFVGWTWDKVFLRKFVIDKGLYFQEQRTTNDLFFTYMALASASRISILENVLAHHRIHVVTSLEATRSQSYKCFYYALIELRKGLKKFDIYERFEQDFINYCLSFSLENLNSMKEPLRKTLADNLRSSWFKELRIADYQKDFFYRKDEYLQYRRIMSFLYNDYCYKVLQGVRKVKDKLLCIGVRME